MYGCFIFYLLPLHLHLHLLYLLHDTYRLEFPETICMGMPVNNNYLLPIEKQPTNTDNSRNVEKPKSPRQRNIAALTPPSHDSDKSLGRNLSAPEFPPIGIKPSSPSYSSPTSRRPSDSGLEPNVDSYTKRTRRSPLSPTSTTSSQGSHKSLRLSPAGGGLNRSRTWTGDLNNSQHGSGKLETLYEAPPTPYIDLEPSLAKLSIYPAPGKESKVIASTVTSPPPILERHKNIKSSQTITLISTAQTAADNGGGSSQFPTTPPVKLQLTANRLSQENLKKLRRGSQSSSISSIVAPVAARANSDTGYDTDDEKEHRIVEWLIGVETSQTDQPPEVADLATNEKRDTAIHIVYKED